MFTLASEHLGASELVTLVTHQDAQWEEGRLNKIVFMVWLMSCSETSDPFLQLKSILAVKSFRGKK